MVDSEIANGLTKAELEDSWRCEAHPQGPSSRRQSDLKHEGRESDPKSFNLNQLRIGNGASEFENRGVFLNYSFRKF